MYKTLVNTENLDVVRFKTNPPGGETVKKLSKATGIDIQDVAGRILMWFAEQPGELQRAVVMRSGVAPAKELSDLVAGLEAAYEAARQAAGLADDPELDKLVVARKRKPSR